MYQGVTTVSLPASKVWTPDIILYNTVGPHKTETDQKSVKVTVTNDGTVTWIPPVSYQSSCVVNMEEYPFDVQTCKMKFGSWMYDQTQMDINFVDGNAALEMHSYHESTEWKLVSSTAEKTLVDYPCCPNPFVEITYNLRAERRMTFHMRLFLEPTPFLATLALGIFWVPPKRNDRIKYGIFWIPPNRPDRTAFGLTLFSSFFLLLILV